MRNLIISVIAAISLAACSNLPNNGIGQTAGGAGGAVLGGIAGSQIGSGSGNLWATGAGAVLGALAGQELGRGYDQNAERSRTHNNPRPRRKPPHRNRGYHNNSNTRGCWSCGGNHPNNPGAAGAYHEGRGDYLHRQQERMEDRAYERGRRGY